MWRLTQPTDTSRDVFTACVQNIRNPRLRTRLLSCTEEINQISQTYKQKAEREILATLPSQQTIAGIIKKEEMIKIYKNKFTRKRSPGRKYYDKLMAAPKYGRCPICGVGTVTTLDHYLPKTTYPGLALTPLNLVPCCSDCNKKKRDEDVSIHGNETIHPYFDDFDSECWLYATVKNNGIPVVEFFVNPPQNWTISKKKAYYTPFYFF